MTAFSHIGDPSRGTHIIGVTTSAHGTTKKDDPSGKSGGLFARQDNEVEEGSDEAHHEDDDEDDEDVEDQESFDHQQDVDISTSDYGMDLSIESNSSISSSNFQFNQQLQQQQQIQMQLQQRRVLSLFGIGTLDTTAVSSSGQNSISDIEPYSGTTESLSSINNSSLAQDDDIYDMEASKMSGANNGSMDMSCISMNQSVLSANIPVITRDDDDNDDQDNDNDDNEMIIV
ncbi:hypothetical protein SAMD00019534_084210 [Acytostelium subglobosum LB1]|uniref:hypothetical protein n=1 Tax=Acytostelium subglobosum LB1 TaxID=1410327 RepID=UPI000644A1BE|nr:hypothetical protein SAMD00019534_084210 [Acytostelium subglobosum LB1]GAM25246.1 hypothetical protein SAMD00019534_084210 [Acytostelium subglobosum LB1]|eukprot:XP_012751766.1 hypothetical protein SAMD00019534_084210 [Acytostelium subglobosum LB1]